MIRNIPILAAFELTQPSLRYTNFCWLPAFDKYLLRNYSMKMNSIVTAEPVVSVYD